jgi:thiol-disulfide isomerase/thioredoxin
MRVFTLFVVLLCSLLTGCGKADYQTLDGHSGRFKDLQGRWLLVNYWASWCVPCIKEIPELNQFATLHGDKASVFAVNFDGVQGPQLQEQVAKLGFAIPVLLADPAATLGYARPQALPSTFVFSPDGKLQQVLQGEQTVATLSAAIGAAAAP